MVEYETFSLKIVNHILVQAMYTLAENKLSFLKQLGGIGLDGMQLKWQSKKIKILSGGY